MNQLQKLQQKNALVPDGIIGPITLAQMQCTWGIQKKEHLAHFLGQIAHETANFQFEEENLNYSAAALCGFFWKVLSYQGICREICL